MDIFTMLLLADRIRGMDEHQRKNLVNELSGHPDPDPDPEDREAEAPREHVQS
jgi:hypothetical protein